MARAATSVLAAAAVSVASVRWVVSTRTGRVPLVVAPAGPVRRAWAPWGWVPGRGGGEEDKEHFRPSYLVETDDVFSGGEMVAPPVIGETPPPR
ncbi:hypothetical protein [Longimycelium tulufanense]|uniref:hypothetical protein n=1 Tax=Longimycelium tulufanense TaxID=907463 RepID=UPI00166C1E73|nr:hypothetical protein [Longimycelium tulufanense]